MAGMGNNNDTGFWMFYDWVDDLNYLPPADAWAVVNVVRDYYANGNDTMDALPPIAKPIASAMLHQIKRNEKKSECCRKGAAATNGKRKSAAMPTADRRMTERIASAERTQSERRASAERTQSAATDTDTDTNTDTDTETKRPPVSPPQGADVRAERFDVFWTAYPKKVAKAAALKAWKSLSPDEELLGTILAALERQKQSDQWVRDNGQFIPNPATWISGRRWNDELPEKYSPYCQGAPIMDGSMDESSDEYYIIGGPKKTTETGN